MQYEISFTGDRPISLISVVMPVYNGERFVRGALESVLAQSFTDQEVLVFDDGSTDSSAEIIRSIAKHDNRVVVHLRDHQGYTRLLNEGIANAQGEFLARMDADDVCEPERLERQVRYLREQPGAVAIGAGLILIDDEGDAFTVAHPPTRHTEIDAAHLQGAGGSLPHPTLMARTEAMRAIGGYRPQFEPAEDLDVMLRLAEVGELANLPESLLRYRVHDRMTSVVKRERQLAAIPRIVAEARIRRGMPPATDVDFCIERAMDDSPGRRCQQAFHSGFYRTAAKYALRECRRHPWQVANWAQWLRMSYLRFKLGSEAPGQSWRTKTA